MKTKSKPIFIAEIKTKSPFGYTSPHSFNQLMDTAIEHGNWISVLDSALWGGDTECISMVRKYTNKPILAKGLHTTDDSITRAIDAGADYVLVVDRLPSSYGIWDKCLFEFDSFKTFEFRMTFDTWLGAQKHVANSRDLRTGKPIEGFDISQFTDYKSKVQGIENVWVCQASGIKTKADIHPKVDAFIVGTHLMDFVRS
jgi:indole-3-glycerol phosphate synthase